MSLSIIIPAYNEEERIETTLKRLYSKFGENVEVVVIFDGNDRTPEVVRKFPAKLYVSRMRLGKGGAIKEGIKRAKGDIILLLDADMPITEGELEKMLREVENADLIIPYRKILGMPLIRRILHHGFNFVVKLFFPSLIKIKDFQGGVKIIKAKVAKEILNELIINDFLIDTNLIYAVKRKGFKIKQVKINYIHDESGSKISKKLLKIIVFMFLSVVKLRVYYSRLNWILNTHWYLRAQKYILNKLR